MEAALAPEADNAKGKSAFARVLRKIFGRQLMHMAILLLLPMILSGRRNPVTVVCDPDIWWHIANARILCDSHHFIQIEPYSFTVAKQRWVDPEWLSEIPFWLSYKSFGLVGIYLVAWLGVERQCAICLLAKLQEGCKRRMRAVDLGRRIYIDVGQR